MNFEREIQKWYHGYSLPSNFAQRDSIQFFTSNCMGLFGALVAGSLGTEVVVRFVDTPKIQIAACDTDAKIIYFAKSLFSVEAEERFNKDASLRHVLAAIMGITLHETSHFKWTDMNYDDAIALNGRKMNSITQSLLNIVDDIYIDLAAWKELPHLRWTMAARTAYVFTEEMRKERLEALPNTIKTLDDVAAAVNVVVLFKDMNWSLQDYITANAATLPTYMGCISSEIKKVEKCHGVVNRAEIALNIYDILVAEYVNSSGDSEDDFEEMVKGKGGKGDGEDEGKGESGEGGTPVKVINKSDGPTDEEDGEGDGESGEVSEDGSGGEGITIDDPFPGDSQTDFPYSECDEGVDVKAKNVNRRGGGRELLTTEFEPTTEKLRRLVDGSLGWSSGISEYMEDLIKTLRSGGSDERYFKFAQLMMSMSQRRTYSGVQRSRGSNISKLYRIATDGKIFNQPQVQKGLGPQEIIILGDASGSMGGTRMVNTILAAAGAIKGLESAGHRTAFYMHSGDITLTDGKNSDLIIYKLKDFDEPHTLMMSRLVEFAQNAKEYSLLRENNDDLAIKHMATKFSGLPNSKTLLVISDGAPSSRTLRGNEGTRSTKEAVQELRRNVKCKVISISIAKTAVATNNEIYGRDNNFDNEDPAVVTNIIEAMLKA